MTDKLRLLHVLFSVRSFRRPDLLKFEVCTGGYYDGSF